VSPTSLADDTRGRSFYNASVSGKDVKTHRCEVLMEQLGRTLKVRGFDPDEVLRVSKGLADVASGAPTQIATYVDARGSSGASVHTQVRDMSVGGSTSPLGDLDLVKLADELRQLCIELSRISRTPEEESALMNVVKAETSVGDRDFAKAAAYLKHAGTWALGVASKIGTSVAIAAIKHSMSLA